MNKAFPLLKQFCTFIAMRHLVQMKKRGGLPKPWTDDEILQTYRFCNIYRELDTVTQWIAGNWRFPHRNDPDLWFAMAVARLVNWPDSLAAVGYPAPWNAKRFVKHMDARKAAGEKVFTGAYMIHAGPNPGSKAGYLAEEVLTPMWEKRKALRPTAQDTLASFHERLMTCKDMGSFMAGQVVADVKYAGLLADAEDWHTWAAPGPGSKRGLNRVCGNERDEKWRDDHWLQVLQELREEVNKALPDQWERLHAQDVQNCLCEFDKYERVRLGEGRPRSLYNGRV